MTDEDQTAAGSDGGQPRSDLRYPFTTGERAARPYRDSGAAASPASVLANEQALSRTAVRVR